eukprot:scaffold3363_cov122-Isochrysis_galbana.AAC.4
MWLLVWGGVQLKDCVLADGVRENVDHAVHSGGAVLQGGAETLQGRRLSQKAESKKLWPSTVRVHCPFFTEWTSPMAWMVRRLSAGGRMRRDTLLSPGRLALPPFPPPPFTISPGCPKPRARPHRLGEPLRLRIKGVGNTVIITCEPSRFAAAAPSGPPLLLQRSAPCCA